VTSTPRIVGADISLTGTGLADNHGWCHRVGRTGILKLHLHERADALLDLADTIITGILNPMPALLVVEQPALSKAYGGANERAGLWWRIVHLARAANVPVAEVTPTALKRYALGRAGGAASGKGAVIEAVTRRFPQYETGGDDNLADAVVLAAMGADYLGCPLAAMPSTHRAALGSVRWPEVDA